VMFAAVLLCLRDHQFKDLYDKAVFINHHHQHLFKA
jgi:hypothetical protein